MSEGHRKHRAANGREGRRAVVALLVIVLLSAACESVTVTTAPGSPGATGAAPGSVGPGESTPLGSGAIDPSPGGPDGDEPAIPPVPFPTLTDPFDIGSALYDPSLMAQAVVSLLSLMGVGIYRDDGTPIDTDAATKAGDPWLFESEVWGLIEMGREDVLEAPEDGPRFRLDDLYEGLKEGLPAGFTLEQFRTAYGDSYATHPDDLAPSVMLGQPIVSSTPMTRVQLWLLYMDGFAELAAASSANVRAGPVAAGGRPRSGTARANLPKLAKPQSLTDAQWRELLPHFGLIFYQVGFGVVADLAHEGHGGLGSPAGITARFRAGRDFVSPTTGAVLLQAGDGRLDGLRVTWQTDDLAIYNAHGTFAASVPGTSTTDAGGEARITYTPKREAANGQGAVAQDFATIWATTSMGDLIERAYRVDHRSIRWWLKGLLFELEISKMSRTIIEWHTPGIAIEIVNTYDVTVDSSTGGLLAFAHRKGTDTFTGTLTKRDDGTYRGVLIGHSVAAAQMEFAAGVSDIQCEDTTNDTQFLTVVARRREAAIDRALDVLSSGAFGPDDFVLQFFPASPPDEPGRCQGTIAYVGPGPDGRPMDGWYSSYSDSRFTDPSLGGLRVHLPKVGEKLVYEDWRLAKENLPPRTGVDSLFTITIDRQSGS